MSIFSKLLGRKTVNKISREFRKVRDVAFEDILGNIPGLPLAKLLELLPLVQEEIRKASPQTWTSYETARGIDRHILHEGAESAEELHR